MTISVRRNDELKRYEAVTQDGTVAGFAQFTEDSSKMTFTHTEVDDAFGGQGVGSELVRGALDGARAADKSVVVLCPFVKKFIDENDEYSDLVA